MARMTLDCRKMPSDSGCSLTLSGEAEEVLRAGVAHAVDVHGHTDDEALRTGMRAALVPATDAAMTEGSFVQLIEIGTGRIDDVVAADHEWTDAIGDARTVRWALYTAERDRPDHYVAIVGFTDADSAATNSGHPATAAFADRLSKLCDDGPTFRDLDVRGALT